MNTILFIVNIILIHGFNHITVITISAATVSTKFNALHTIFLHEQVLFLQPVLHGHEITYCNAPGAIGSSIPIGMKTPLSILQP